MNGVRMGIGWDSHRLVDGRPLMVGLVHVPFEKGPAGHSDGDVVAHAITDAMLGSLALGDIGRHFPDNDPRWKSARGEVFLAKARDMLAERGYRVTSVDSVVILERPKLAPHIDRMREELARVLGLPAECVSVKAKTAEKMGPAGEGLAIECQAVVVVQS